MPAPVWVLSVDLQTKTATFTSGLADAAKGARTSFQDIKSGAADMGAGTGYSMKEARHSVMLLGEEFGVHMPRALTSFIAGLGPLGGALEAAFPFLAIAVGATLLLQHLAKLREEADKLARSQMQFGTTVNNVFNTLDEKLLQAGIKADELNQNHLAALHKQLEVIDHQSLAELVHAFNEVAKAADLTFAELKTHWYSFSSGSVGAKHALDDFKARYDLLLAQGKDKEASDLLAGTRKSAERVLELQKQAASNQTVTGVGGVTQKGDYAKFEEAKLALQKLGITFTEKEVEAQQKLVEALQAQATVQEKVAALKQAQDSNAGQTTRNKIDTDTDKQVRMQVQEEKKAADEAQRVWDENYRTAVAALQECEREKIDATRSGSQARLAAIDAAIQEENAKGLQETGFYRGLLTARIQNLRQATEEEDRIRAEAGKLAAEHELRMGELALAAQREDSMLQLAGQRRYSQERVAMEIDLANKEHQVKMAAYAQEAAALDKNGKDYDNKLKALQNRELELTRAHENQVTQIKNRAATDQEMHQRQALARMENGFAQSFLRVLQGHQSFASMMGGLSQQIISNIISEAIAEKAGLESTKMDEAKAAARKMYLAGTKFPWPTNIVMAPTLAAVGFAAMMAFEGGGIVPGAGRGDIVPAMLTPGESVLPKDLTEGLQNAARSGNLGGNGAIHLHHAPTYHIQTIDSAGIREVLSKHKDEFAKHFHGELRKMNR